MKNAYVTALTDSILAGQPVEEALSLLKVMMTKRGHLRLYSQVLKATKRVIEAKQRTKQSQIVLAKEGGVTEEIIQSALKRLGASSADYQKTIDPTLVGGFTARVDGAFYDASYKRTLVDLYRRITK